MELLAPAGNWQGFKAVLAQKPDVIYLGAGDLNARSEEAQFALADLPDLVAQARLVGTKIHFTLNVLIKADEMARALDLARQADQAGVAAIIVQDKGLMLAIRQALPHAVIHASTQCSVGSREQIAELVDLGVSRVVLARELSLDQIADLTAYAHSLGMEVEVFVHGATCMSVSGQCHMSFCRGGRSANRGACAQPCRLSYQILENDKPLRASAAYLSPKDLSYFPYLKDLSKIGVDSLKIEGRLRSPEYQAQVTAIFQQALTELDQALSDPDRALTDSQIFTAERERNLTIAFNRGGGFQAAFLQNQRDADFLSPDQVGHYGYYLGQVTEIKDRQGILLYALDEGLDGDKAMDSGSRAKRGGGSWTGVREKDYLPNPGSQISLKNAEGVSVASAPVGIVRRSKTPGKVEIQGFHPRVLRKLRLPLTVWQQKQDRVVDQDLRSQATPTKEGVWMSLSLATPPRTRPMKPIRQIVGHEDHKKANHSDSAPASQHYILELSTKTQTVTICSDELANPPQNTGSPIDLDRIRQQMGKLGNTPYQLMGFETSLGSDDLPRWRIADLNAFRRAGLTKLEAASGRPTFELASPGLLSSLGAMAQSPPGGGENPDQAARLAPIPALELAIGRNAPLREDESLKIRGSKPDRSQQVQKIIYLPNYQAGDDLSALSGRAGELYIFPLEELCQSNRQGRQGLLHGDLSPASWGAYLSPLRAWSCALSIEAALSELVGQGLSALVSPSSGLVELVRQSGLDQELLSKLDLYLWQGAQISNRQSYAFLSARGYDGLMISPELSQGDQEKLAASCSAISQSFQEELAGSCSAISQSFQEELVASCSATAQEGLATDDCTHNPISSAAPSSPGSQRQTRPILMVSGPLEAMFTRFCPLGYSRGLEACGLCRREAKRTDKKPHASYALQDEESRRFPLTPKAWADCSLQIWESNPRQWQPHVDCILGFNYLDPDLSRLRAVLDPYA